MSAAVSTPGPSQDVRPVRRALVSVYDKTGLEDLARALDAAGVGIVSTGSTAKTIAALGIEVTPVEQLTGFPECLEGRVKTLHPKVHAGILADTTDGTGFPAWTGATFDRAAALRYGENPHQQAALYRHWRAGVASAEQLHGKEMSYNNYVDTDAAVRAAHDHGDQPTVAIIKHANPCGIAIGETIEQAYERAHATDPVSAYGGIIAANRTVTAAMAAAAKPVFTEVIIAPDYEPEALEILTAKKNLRILRLPAGMAEAADPIETRAISGGLLVQTVDKVDAVVRGDDDAVTGGDDAANWRLVAGEAADGATLADLQFAWRAVRAVKSNAILLAKDGAAVGVGMGQVNRVDSCYLAVRRAGKDRAHGSVAASDAFFPFPDGLEVLVDAGIRAVVQPGGSVRDELVVEAAQKAGVTMYLTGTRHFFH